MLHVVHELKGLQGSVGAVTPDARRLAGGHVEVFHERVGGGALQEGVEGASIEVGSRVLLVVARVGTTEGERLPDVRRLVGVHALAAEVEIDQAADEEGLVTDLLGIEPEARSAGQHPVFGIVRPALGRGAALLAEGTARHHQTDELFHVPAAFPE